MTSKVILFFVNLKLLYARKLGSKLVVRMFCFTVQRFLATVQSPTCTTNGKFLLKSIMTVLTPKSGIVSIFLKHLCSLFLEDACHLFSLSLQIFDPFCLSVMLFYSTPNIAPKLCPFYCIWHIIRYIPSCLIPHRSSFGRDQKSCSV